MIGTKKPMAGLVVQPAKVMAYPIPGITRAKSMDAKIMQKVTIRFWFFVMPSLYLISSMESLHGSTHRGMAAMVAKSTAKLPIRIGMFFFQGDRRMFWSFKSTSGF